MDTLLKNSHVYTPSLDLHLKSFDMLCFKDLTTLQFMAALDSCTLNVMFIDALEKNCRSNSWRFSDSASTGRRNEWPEQTRRCVHK